MKFLPFLLSLFMLALYLPPAQAQIEPHSANVSVTVKRVQEDQEAFFEIHASGLAHSSPQKAWQVLTDYDRLYTFLPNLLSSKVIERNGPQALVEENGSFDFLFIKRTIHLIVRVTEHPVSALDIALVKGDMKHYATHWDIASAASSSDNGSGTRLSYIGRVEPDFFTPSLIGAAVLRSNVKQMMEAMITEIDKTP